MSDLREALTKVEELIRRDPACFNLSDELQSVRSAIRATLSAQPQPDAVEAVAWRIRVVDGSYCKVIPEGELEVWKQNWSHHLASGHARPGSLRRTPAPRTPSASGTRLERC
jgi:hypothetical protein